MPIPYDRHESPAFTCSTNCCQQLMATIEAQPVRASRLVPWLTSVAKAELAMTLHSARELAWPTGIPRNHRHVPKVTVSQSARVSQPCRAGLVEGEATISLKPEPSAHRLQLAPGCSGCSVCERTLVIVSCTSQALNYSHLCIATMSCQLSPVFVFRASWFQLW